MKSYIIVVQTAANDYRLLFYEAESINDLYNQYRYFGMAIAILEDTVENTHYCFEMAKRLNESK